MRAPFDPVGSTLAGRYHILEKIGAGGMGEVYLAEHTTISKKIAIKVLGDDFTRKPELVDRFLQEARASSLIRHENIVDITDFGHSDEGVPFFAMEYLEGEDLRSTIKREGALPWPRVRTIMLQVLAALSAAHQKGIVHRDMKPDNCYRITHAGNADFIKVLDFGIAKVIGDDVDHQTLTRTGAVIGTAHYMSPEQAKSEKLDARADLYSAGVIMFQLLTGKVPFEAGGFMGVLSKHITEDVPQMKDVALHVDVHPKVEAIVRRALEKSPADRWQSAEQFADAIRELPAELEAAPPESGGVPWLAVAGIAAALLGGVVILVASGGDDETPMVAADDAPAKVAAPAPAPAPEPEPEPEPPPPPDPAPELEQPELEQPEPEPEPEPKKKHRKIKKHKEASSAPTPTPDEGPIDALQPRHIKPGVTATRKAAIACGTKHGALPGMTVKVKFTIGPDGKVKGAQPQPPFAGSKLGRCVADAFAGQTFPESKRGRSGTIPFPVAK